MFERNSFYFKHSFVGNKDIFTAIRLKKKRLFCASFVESKFALIFCLVLAVQALIFCSGIGHTVKPNPNRNSINRPNAIFSQTY